MPPVPGGTNREAVFHRNTWQRLHVANKVNGSSTVRVSYTTRGIFLRAKPGRGGGGGTSVCPYG